jgi:pyrroloquinoline-quinone synthase
LDDTIQHNGWEVAAAIVTIFIEGTKDEAMIFDPAHCAATLPPLEDHPLVKHYGLALEHLALTKAHRQVEGSHRAAAWKVILDHVTPTRRGPVIRAMEAALGHWLSYRDAVAQICGLQQSDNGASKAAVFG